MDGELAKLIFVSVLGILWLYWVISSEKRKKQKAKVELEKRNKQKAKAELEESSKKKEALKKSNLKLKSKLKKVDSLAKKLSEIQEIKIIDISDYKKIIIDNEKNKMLIK